MGMAWMQRGIGILYNLRFCEGVKHHSGLIGVKRMSYWVKRRTKLGQNRQKKLARVWKSQETHILRVC